jgi:hypothetical protein
MKKGLSGLCAVGLLLVSACSGYRTTLTPTLSVTEEYSDNVNASSDAKKSDFITSIVPGLSLITTSQGRDLAFTYSPSIAYRAESDTNISTGHNATLTASNRFSRHTRLDFSDTFTRTDDPYVRRELEFTRGEEPQQPQDVTRRQNREPYYTNSTMATLRSEFGADDSFFARYQNQILTNDDPTVENSIRHEPSIGVTYWLTPRYGIDARAVYTRGDFSLETDPFNEYCLVSTFTRRFSPQFDVFLQYTHTAMDFQGPTEKYQVFAPTLGMDFHVSQETFLALSGGLYYRSPDRSDPTTGYVLRGDMARRFSRGALRVSGGTGYQQTFFGAENLGFTEYYEGTVAGTYNLSRRLSGEGSASYTHNDYVDIGERVDDIIILETGLSYLIRPWLSSALRFTHREVDSSEPNDSFAENRVTLSLTFVPTRPWVFE